MTGDTLRAAFALTATAGLVVVIASAGSMAAAGLTVGGLVAAGAGVRRVNARVHLLGTAGLVGGLLVAGVEGASSAALVVGTVAALLAYDAGAQGIGLANQLGTDAGGRRALLTHVGLSAVVLSIAGGGTFLVSSLVRAGQPTVAVALLVAGLAVIGLYEAR